METLNDNSNSTKITMKEKIAQLRLKAQKNRQMKKDDPNSYELESVRNKIRQIKDNQNKSNSNSPTKSLDTNPDIKIDQSRLDNNNSYTSQNNDSKTEYDSKTNYQSIRDNQKSNQGTNIVKNFDDLDLQINASKDDDLQPINDTNQEKNIDTTNKMNNISKDQFIEMLRRSRDAKNKDKGYEELINQEHDDIESGYQKYVDFVRSRENSKQSDQEIHDLNVNKKDSLIKSNTKISMHQYDQNHNKKSQKNYENNIDTEINCLVNSQNSDEMQTGRDQDCKSEDIENIINDSRRSRSSIDELKNEYKKKSSQNKLIEQILQKENKKNNDMLENEMVNYKSEINVKNDEDIFSFGKLNLSNNLFKEKNNEKGKFKIDIEKINSKHPGSNNKLTKSEQDNIRDKKIEESERKNIDKFKKIFTKSPESNKFVKYTNNKPKNLLLDNNGDQNLSKSPKSKSPCSLSKSNISDKSSKVSSERIDEIVNRLGKTKISKRINSETNLENSKSTTPKTTPKQTKSEVNEKFSKFQERNISFVERVEKNLENLDKISQPKKDNKKLPQDKLEDVYNRNMNYIENNKKNKTSTSKKSNSKISKNNPEVIDKQVNLYNRQLDYQNNTNQKINTIKKSLLDKEYQEEEKIKKEKENLKMQIKKTSAFKDKSNINEPIDLKWKKRKEQIKQEINKDCTFQPQPSPMKSAKKIITNGKIENVHDRLQNNFKNNIFEFNGGVNYHKLFKECNPITSSVVFSENDLNPGKQYNGKKIVEKITDQIESSTKKKDDKKSDDSIFDKIISELQQESEKVQNKEQLSLKNNNDLNFKNKQDKTIQESPSKLNLKRNNSDVFKEIKQINDLSNKFYTPVKVKNV